MFYYYQQQSRQEPRTEKGNGITDYHEKFSASVCTFLPHEILEEILSEAWLSDMSTVCRGHFVVSVSLVSKSWLAMFARIFARDVYITSSSCLKFYRRLLDGSVSIVRSQNLPETPLIDLCRSFVRQLPLHRKTDRYPLCLSHSFTLRPGKYMRDMMSTFRILPYLPSLRSLSLEYYATPTDPITQDAFKFPVVQFELEYSFASDTPGWLVDELGLSDWTDRCFKQQHVPWALPDLDHISTADASSVGEFLRCCPHLELEPEERAQIKVRILSASRPVPPGCTIVHGAMEPSSCVVLRRREGLQLADDNPECLIDGPAPRGVRGRALGIIISNKFQNYQAPVEIIAYSNRWRNVYVCSQRRGR